ncbi:MAG: porin [Planctomycetota bacterium]|nr:MAG: porin [Planctomycetota bacterium]
MRLIQNTAPRGAAVALALLWPLFAVGQEESFVGRPGQAGSFESFDPVLTDDVMTGMIPSGQDWFLFGEGDRGGISGWLNGGFVGNFGVPRSKFNGPYNAVDRANEAMMNQVYIIGERTLPADGSTGIGARTDVLYGEDFPLAMSLGWETNPGPSDWNSGEYYGLAIPQLYAEVGSRDLSLKLGHFYTIVGYEGVPAVGNFFYQKAYSYQFAGPFTHWGGLVNWNATDNVEFDGGLVNGWNGLASPYSKANFLGRARVKNDDNSLATSFAIVTGDEGNDFSPLFQPAPPLTSANRTRYSLILEYRPSDRWEYLFHHWLGTQAKGLASGGTALWAGIDQYLYYRVSKTWLWGARFEWFQDTDGTRVGLNRPSNPNHVPLPGNFYSLTVGPNWTPTGNFLMRPCFRWDFFGGPTGPRRAYNDGVSNQQTMLGFDLIQKF